MNCLSRAILALAAAITLVTCTAPPDRSPTTRRDQDIAADEFVAVGSAELPVLAEGIEESADELLRAASALLSSAQRFRFHFEVTEEEFLASGQLVDTTRDGDVLVRRPDGIRVERRDAGRHRKLFYDGRTAALLDVDANLYMQPRDAVPGDLDGFVAYLIDRHDVNIPLADVVLSDPYAAFVDPAVSGVDLGTARVRGDTCRHLVFTNGQIEWQIFIAADGPPLLRKVVIHYADEPGTPRWEAILSEWDLNADIPDDTFSFRPPEGSHRIETARPAEEPETEEEALR